MCILNYCSKRAAPSDIFPADAAHGHPRQSPADYPNMPLQSQNERAGAFGAETYRDPYDDQPIKRQRLSIDLARKTTYEQEQQLSQRSYIQPRDHYAQISQRDPMVANRGSYYSQGPSSASGSMAADFNFGHQRTNSSSTSSPFVSPRTEYPGYSFSAPSNSLYQQPARDPAYQYSQNQYAGAPSRQIPQLSQPTPPYRPPPPSIPSQTEQSRPYSRPYETEEHSPVDRGYGSGQPGSRPDYYNSQHLPTLYDRPSQPLARTLPDPSQPLTSVLPPLQSTLPSSQLRRDPIQSYSSSGASSIESNSQFHPSVQPGQEGQSYMPQLYRGPQNG